MKTLCKMLLLCFILMTSACQPKTLDPPIQAEDPSGSPSGERKSDKEVKFPIKCGINSTTITLKISRPDTSSESSDRKNQNEERYAILLSPSPGTGYFEDYSDKTQKLVQSLKDDLGYNVVQAKYQEKRKACGLAGTMDGFYSACCRQGLPAVLKHNAKLSDEILERSGFNRSKHPNKRLVGIGYSLGTLQLTTMAFDHGIQFDRLAFLGVVHGNVEEGCKNLGWAWTVKGALAKKFFAHLADSMTLSSAGCTEKKGHPLEFTSKYNFDKFPYFDRSQLGIFEGTKSYAIREFVKRKVGRFVTWFSGKVVDLDYNPAKYIEAVRPPGSTKVFWYKDCGHNPWGCSEGSQNLNRDLLKFIDQ